MTSKALQAMAGVAVAGTVVMGGGTVASAGTVAPGGTVTSVGTVALAGTAAALPTGFLLHEKTAREPVKYPGEEKWTISESRTRTLLVNPCRLKRPRDTGRVAMRTVGHTAPEHYSGEQVVIYRSRAAAKAAMAGLRAQVERCVSAAEGPFVTRAHATSVSVGDQAFRFARQNYYESKPAIGGDRAVVVRKARAVAIYTVSGEYGRIRSGDYTDQLRHARRMAAKLCSLRATGC